ncbi:hypothetical protein [Leisingera aquimarina]|uniref:hypothetical protein n=1 Tax=Leisingera aquimarina TaxID=476529 RepID=UPI0012EBBD72|nr:hypothetical protein [Leisingera aquimarina]
MSHLLVCADPKVASVKIPTPQLALQQGDWLFMEKPKEIFRNFSVSACFEPCRAEEG